MAPNPERTITTGAVASPADPLTQRLAEEELLPGMTMFDNKDTLDSKQPKSSVYPMSFDRYDIRCTNELSPGSHRMYNVRTQQFPLFGEKCIEAGVPLNSVVPSCEVSSVVMTMENCG